MNAGVGPSFRPAPGRPRLQVEKRIGIEIGGEDAPHSFGAFRSLEALQFVAKIAIALLRRIEIGEAPGGIGRGRRFGERRAGLGDARDEEYVRRNARRRDARSARLPRIDDDRRGDRRLGLGERVRGEAALERARQR